MADGGENSYVWKDVSERGPANQGCHRPGSGRDRRGGHRDFLQRFGADRDQVAGIRGARQPRGRRYYRFGRQDLPRPQRLGLPL